MTFIIYFNYKRRLSGAHEIFFLSGPQDFGMAGL